LGDPARAEVGVLVVDDQSFVRDAIRVVLDAAVGFSVAGEASSGREAIAAVAALSPELVLIDVRMPGMTGLEATRQIVGDRPGTVVVLTSTDDLTDAPTAVRRCGAAAFVRKQDLGTPFLRAVWAQHGPHLG
jgi:DNA-binding NarL/FixJ family response regulator